MAGVVVLLQHVATEIVFKVAIDGVDVVGVVLRVIVLDDEVRTLHAVIVRLAAFEAAGPGEENLIGLGGVDFLQVFAGGVFTITENVFLDDVPEDLFLSGIEFGGGNTVGRNVTGGAIG